MTTLFLDFDGILHPEFSHASRHFCCLSFFEAAMRQVPEVSIVVSSTWRFHSSLDRLREYFSRDIANRIVGTTPRFTEIEMIPDRLTGFEREAECYAWLRDNGRGMLPWIALDDRPWLFRPFSRQVFLVDGKKGLDQECATRLVELLRTC